MLPALFHNVLAYFVGTNNQGQIDRVGFWTAITAGTAIAGLIFIYRQIQLAQQTSKADFLHRFSESFANEDTRDVIKLIEGNFLTLGKRRNPIIKEEVPVFIIEKTLLRGTKLMAKDRIERLPDEFSAHEIIDFLIGYFEDIGNYLDRGLIDVGMVYDSFGYYIEMSWKSAVIKGYIDLERKEEPDFFDGFEKAYNRIIKEKSKRNFSLKK